MVFLTAKQSDRTFLNFMGATATPQGFLLPVLGILLVTSEWTQRTALVTFTLVPVRGRVMAAKVARGAARRLRRDRARLGVAALATVVGGAADAWANIGLDDFGKFGLLQATGVLQGLAFGLLFLNSAAAIVIYFVRPDRLLDRGEPVGRAEGRRPVDRPRHLAAAAVQRGRT